MSDPKSTDPRPRAGGEIPAIPARWGFWKGLLTGAAIEVPVLATTVWVLAEAGVGDPAVPFMRIMRLTAVFAGVAAVLTAAGIGRLAAHASADGGRRRAMFVAARAHAAASAGLVIIAAIPHGHLPDHSSGWLPIPLAGLVAGAICGALIGVVCGGTAPVGFADVWSLARKPSVALRQLLGPEDLVRLGSALGTRTRSLFEGIFDPAPLPPKATETPPPPPPPLEPPPSPATPKDE
jgi:hypothetical protein